MDDTNKVSDNKIENNDIKTKNKKKRDYDIGCYPDTLWYSIIGSRIFVPFLVLALRVKAKRDKDFEQTEGPIIVVGNHPSYLDPMIVNYLMRGRKANFVAGEFLFRSKLWGHVFRIGGAIPKKQFVVDTVAVKAMMKVLKRNGILVIFPEATRFVDGKSIGFDDGVARLVKKHKASVFVARINGAHLTYPRWGKTKLRPGKIYASFNAKLPSSEVENMSIEEIQSFLRTSLDYNENDYAREENPHHYCSKRANGLQNILHACPRCQSEFAMRYNLDSKIYRGTRFKRGSGLTCSICGNKILMLPNGLLQPDGIDKSIVELTKREPIAPTNALGQTIDVSSLPAEAVCLDDSHKWTSWQIELIKKQLEEDDFSFTMPCKLWRKYDDIDFAHTGNGTVTITKTEIIYNGTDCENVKDGIPYHKNKIIRGFEHRSIDGIARPSKQVFEIASMKGLVAKFGRNFEVYDSKGELFRFIVDGQAVMKVHQIVSIIGKQN